MRSSWFQKPIYKQVNLITLLLVAISIAFVLFTKIEWYILLFTLIPWITLSALGSYFISSGIYVQAIISGSVKDKIACLTFDDGPCENTEVILEILKKYNAKASFFITGSKIKARENTVRKIINEGHETGNHSYSHNICFPLMRVKKIRNEIEITQIKIQDITGKRPLYFRPPFGVTNPLIAKALKSFDLLTIGWSIRSMDTTNRKPEKIVRKILSQIKPGDIVLFHDTSKHIISVLEEVLVYCRQENYKLVSIGELLKSRNE